ncbi:hypothetical protein SODALDRAFT_320855 [Sodiomyces alkalinus F11]|uniref:Uncharacterized protein n=1 Tax=Sodiomyces alkalinus (strain CBS 110278 / VKM F-3762 / F11) TaxID=1314773 RepID=A0A3N2PMI6_SODAK|nr:hypothetical protein SODALDRAFT_320855 [Sodiomyces alkalinus F11]ROT35546.1 hypothetical protein SODALDRAFT_320855 [Sodiomyces alkalinus F11]
MEIIENEPLQVSMPLPRSLDTRIYIHLTIRTKSITLFLTTGSEDEPTMPPTMGSFIYAVPDRFNPAQPISTTLYSHEPTLEFTTRIAKLLARRSGMPVYVGNSASFANCPEGGTVEEEMDVFQRVVGVVSDRLKHVKRDLPLINGA